MKEIKVQYDFFLENGDLKDLFPEVSFTGEWEKDKSKFTKIWKDNQKFINNLDVK